MCSLGTSIGGNANSGPIILDLPSTVRRESDLYLNSSLTNYHDNQTTDSTSKLKAVTAQASRSPGSSNSDASNTMESPTRSAETIEYPTLDLSTTTEYVSDEKIATDSELSYLLTEMSVDTSEQTKTYMPYIA
ncbi:hypothetical protein K493DRAFT_78968 [Basidiobolus meristosporus CBS 931.73]|uniref:Uncharacterized protein n=1 Tax=Basidiobolus meristosporus CBS 931.73 TaxID=1314790 RepID=A0A1Y1XRH7_9FUNG|nr:hypothetical protein K493DRAFT_78968 [Basidiobolus meristosporus CBS 931.73]|eukprot:ORX88361.1 hypothetical protein K493DRAFT_78968 [Basidiobolus meristosporus CBS 931.73]